MNIKTTRLKENESMAIKNIINGYHNSMLDVIEKNDEYVWLEIQSKTQDIYDRLFLMDPFVEKAEG